MTDTPTVSIIVPLYRVEHYVWECIESLRTQDYADFEVLCIDDCSPDDSARIAQNCAQEDSRFRFFCMENNSGLSAVRNYGIERASGDYILFVDSDDTLAPNALSSLVERARQDNLDDLFFTAFSVYENARLQHTNREDYEHRTNIEGVMSGPDLFVAFQQLDEFVCMAQLHMVRRMFLLENDLQFVPGLIHEDELYSVQTLSMARQAAFLNKPLYGRRLRDDSIMTKPKSIDNVDGLFRVTSFLSQWINLHADQYSADFVDAVAQRFANLRDLCARYSDELSSDTLKEYYEKLSASQQLDFQQYIVCHAIAVKRLYSEIEESRTFRFGHAIMAIPRDIKKLF